MHRRQFLKFGSLAAGAYAFMSCASEKPDQRMRTSSRILSDENNSDATPISEDGEPEFYTKENPGKWAGKEASHLPQLVALSEKIQMKTDHGMQEDHYISRHQIRDSKGHVIADRVIAPTDKPESTFVIPTPSAEYISALSTCNLHGIWKEDFAVKDLLEGFGSDVIYTAENPGPWVGKEGSHLPSIRSSTALANGQFRLEIVTPHVISNEHFISKQQIRNLQGEVLSESLFNPATDSATEAVSIVEIPIPQSGLQLLSYCNLHGIWLKTIDYDVAANVYTAEKIGPSGAPAAHIPTVAILDTSVASNPSYRVTVANTHEMLAEHYVYKHQIRSPKGELIAENRFAIPPPAASAASSSFDGTIFQTALGQFQIYAYCNLHGIWKAQANFEQMNIVYTDTPGLAGGGFATHTPIVSVVEDVIQVKTEHVMTPEHYISKHQVRLTDGTLIYEKNFSSSTQEPTSSFPVGSLNGNFVAYSYCNLHGIWKAEFSIA